MSQDIGVGISYKQPNSYWCWVCGNAPGLGIVETRALYNGDGGTGHGWMCLSCLTAELRAGRLTLIENEAIARHPNAGTPKGRRLWQAKKIEADENGDPAYVEQTDEGKPQTEEGRPLIENDDETSELVNGLGDAVEVQW